MSKQALTADELIDAIRSASSLDELLRLVGPSDEENEQARSRLQALDRVSEACEWDKACPSPSAMRARERYHSILDAQAEYENRYL